MSAFSSPVTSSTVPTSSPSLSSTRQPRSITNQETGSASHYTAFPPTYQTGPCV